jgi:hypothetical protein
MLPEQKPEFYYSYLLRLWRANSHPQRWQVSLKDARTGESFNFSDLQRLKEFLDQRITDGSAQDPLGKEAILPNELESEGE